MVEVHAIAKFEVEHQIAQQIEVPTFILEPSF